ncbi:MAG: RagB/SusD family nutrient uptake outer membrane protein [Flavobacteriaceae bacterium]|jgi:hypothetical protein
MKDLKILFLFALAIFSSCDLDEDPPFLDDSVYSDPEIVVSTLDGIYAALTTYNAQERRLFVINGYSGFFNTRKQGGNINNPNNQNLFSLKPRPNEADVAALWAGLYTGISRANAAISNVPVFDPSTASGDELLFNDVSGQAHFVRAWSYFSLVRLFGDVPLWTELPSSENFMIGLSTAKEVYAQIITDAEFAANNMNGATGFGYVQDYAAHMLLAKVYMTLATNPQLVPDSMSSELNFWQMAYDHAIQVYGQYSLVPDYSSLFTVEAENSSESIFELQVSQVASNSQMGRNYTPNNYKAAQSFGWFTVNADIYDDHAATYPGDSRLAGTYISEYTNNNPNNNWFGSISKVYPSRSRGNFRNSHPFLFKFAVKDVTHSNQYDDKNLIVYRYAELLLMLSEISNELQNGEQLGYVTEVLNRAGVDNTAYAGASQTDFRHQIMKEYRYELIGEGEDAHNNRRRGFDYFLNNIITPHNTNPNLNFNSLDLTLSSDPAQVMYLPLPLTEINTNELID